MITDDHIRLALDIEEGDVAAAARLVQAAPRYTVKAGDQTYVFNLGDPRRVSFDPIRRIRRFKPEEKGIFKKERKTATHACERALRAASVDDPYNVSDEEIENIMQMDDQVQMGLLLACVEKLRGVDINEEQRRSIEGHRVGRKIARKLQIEDRIERENILRPSDEDVLLMLEDEAMVSPMIKSARKT